MSSSLRLLNVQQRWYEQFFDRLIYFFVVESLLFPLSYLGNLGLKGIPPQNYVFSRLQPLSVFSEKV
jgi:hypothetical protein